MSYQIGPGDPSWTFDVAEFEKQCAGFLKAPPGGGPAITTDAGRDAFVAALTQAQVNGAVKVLLNCIRKVG